MTKVKGKKLSNPDFNPFHAQIDYETNIVDVQYEGGFDETLAVEYARKSYPNLLGVVVYQYEPDEIKGYKNMGVIGIK